DQHAPGACQIDPADGKVVDPELVAGDERTGGVGGATRYERRAGEGTPLVRPTQAPLPFRRAVRRLARPAQVQRGSRGLEVEVAIRLVHEQAVARPQAQLQAGRES